MRAQRRDHHAVLRSPAALYFPALGVLVPRHNNVLALLGTPEGVVVHPGHNIVTNAGDTYYAQSICGESQTNTFANLSLGTAGTPGKTADYSDITVIGSTEKAPSSGYPRTADPDADNTGAAADVVTWLYEYAKADFNNGAITHGIVTAATPSGSDPALTLFAFSGGAFGKTANDTLKVFVNHTQTGV